MKYIFPLPLLLVVSCYSSHMAIDWESPDSEEHKELFYCAETDTYIKPQKDPYRIENFQNALDSMLDDAADSKWTKAQRSFLEDLELVPTHYALRMYPRTEEQQWQLETMADISVSYIPFDYVPVLSEDIAGSQRSNVQSFDISGNIITYENLESTMGFIGSVSFNLPVLYVTWPVDKELPENIDYDVDYPIYIPKYETLTKSSLDFDVISTLEKKAIELALGQRGIDPKATKSTSVRGWFTVETYDCYLKKRVPVPHLKVRTQLGSNILDYYTDDNGRFNVALNISDDALVGFVFQHARWKLTTETSTSPRIGWKGTVGGFYENASCPVIFDAPSDQLYEVHRAVDFYYNSSHSIRTWHYDSGIRIIVSSESSSEANAYFTYSRTKPAYITVYDNNASARNKVIGSTLHELGHFTQYGERGGYKKYVSVQDLLAESFASYVGWYLGNRYYEKLSGNTLQYDVSGQARQYWIKTESSKYSPLFVDLVDDYDQSLLLGTSYNKDMVRNFPHSKIRQIAAECATWSDVRSFLNNYRDEYFSGSSGFDEFAAPYDFWFSSNK